MECFGYTDSWLDASEMYSLDVRRGSLAVKGDEVVCDSVDESNLRHLL